MLLLPFEFAFASIFCIRIDNLNHSYSYLLVATPSISHSFFCTLFSLRGTVFSIQLIEWKIDCVLFSFIFHRQNVYSGGWINKLRIWRHLTTFWFVPTNWNSCENYVHHSDNATDITHSLWCFHVFFFKYQIDLVANFVGNAQLQKKHKSFLDRCIWTLASVHL